MKYLPLLPILFLSISLQAQTTGASGTADAAANAGANISHNAAQTTAEGTAAANANAAASASRQTEQAASAAGATNVSAELTRKLDTKHAKVGDEVFARTTQTATLADGTKLPRGTKLIGKVTKVQARSRADKSAHLAFALDHAVLRNGHEVPVHAVLTSVTAVSAAASMERDTQAAEGGAQGGARASRAGLLGGAGGAVGGAVGGVSHTAGNLGGAVESGADSAVNATSAAGGAVANVGASGTLDHVPVANLPGVTLSSSTSASSSGSLDASGSNIDLESGTQMTFNLSASQQ